MKQSTMEQLIFSYAYYIIADFDKFMAFFKTLHENGLFTIDKSSSDKKMLSGAFIRPYPKNHWSPFAKSSAGRQVIGHMSAKDGNLKLETMTKSGLKEARQLLESALGEAILFDREEYRDPLGR